eukprot:scaffold42980_cov206-Amphora_coffeaeformis.AAC.1
MAVRPKEGGEKALENDSKRQKPMSVLRIPNDCMMIKRQTTTGWVLFGNQCVKLGNRVVELLELRVLCTCTDCWASVQPLQVTMMMLFSGGDVSCR